MTLHFLKVVSPINFKLADVSIVEIEGVQYTVERGAELIFLLLVRSAALRTPLTADVTDRRIDIIKVVIIRLSYTHRFYENAFSKTVLDTYTV